MYFEFTRERELFEAAAASLSWDPALEFPHARFVYEPGVAYQVPAGIDVWSVEKRDRVAVREGDASIAERYIPSGTTGEELTTVARQVLSVARAVRISRKAYWARHELNVWRLIAYYADTHIDGPVSYDTLELVHAAIRDLAGEYGVSREVIEAEIEHIMTRRPTNLTLFRGRAAHDDWAHHDAHTWVDDALEAEWSDETHLDMLERAEALSPTGEHDSPTEHLMSLRDDVANINAREKTAVNETLSYGVTIPEIAHDLGVSRTYVNALILPTGA